MARTNGAHINARTMTVLSRAGLAWTQWTRGPRGGRVRTQLLTDAGRHIVQRIWDACEGVNLRTAVRLWTMTREEMAQHGVKPGQLWQDDGDTYELRLSVDEEFGLSRFSQDALCRIASNRERPMTYGLRMYNEDGGWVWIGGAWSSDIKDARQYATREAAEADARVVQEQRERLHAELAEQGHEVPPVGSVHVIELR